MHAVSETHAGIFVRLLRMLVAYCVNPAYKLVINISLAIGVRTGSGPIARTYTHTQTLILVAEKKMKGKKTKKKIVFRLMESIDRHPKVIIYDEATKCLDLCVFFFVSNFRQN